MKKEDLKQELIRFITEEFEIENPAPDDNLTDLGFDSIDAIELMAKIEDILGSELTKAEKEGALDIRSINQIVGYIGKLALKRNFTIED